jgi:hypothetical protein
VNSYYYVPKTFLNSTNPVFSPLSSSKEKKYAHHLGEASWAGARIVLGQWTPFTERLYDFLILTFSENGTITDLNRLKEKSGLSEDEWDRLLEFVSQVIAYFLTVGPRSLLNSSLIMSRRCPILPIIKLLDSQNSSRVYRKQSSLLWSKPLPTLRMPSLSGMRCATGWFWSAYI